MKGIWGWVGLFLFSVFMGAISAKAAAPLNSRSHAISSDLLGARAFQEAVDRAHRLDSRDRVAHAENEEPDPTKKLEFCKTEKWAETCLNLLLTYRCNGYSFPLPAAGCSSAGDAFVKLLSIKKIDVKINRDRKSVV